MRRGGLLKTSTVRRQGNRENRQLATLAALALAALGIMPAAANAYVYWTDSYADSYPMGRIGRANLDGSGADRSIISGPGPGFPDGPIDGLAVDAGHIYWTNFLENKIGRANLDGSGADQSFIGGAGFPSGIAVDAGHIYWTNDFTITIGRASLDGSGANQSFITGASNPYGVAVDAHHVYWANSNTGTIGRANLDGSGADQSFITGGNGPRAVAVDSLQPPNTTIESVAVNRGKRRASFRFSSSQLGSFRCSLDGRAFRRCASPRTYEHLEEGKHTFRVKARNAQGVDDPSPAKRRFRI